MKNISLQVHKLLIERKKTLAVAESCTGGLVSCLLTRYPGSSKYLYASVVTYNNRAKEKILNVPQRLISKKGSVSQEVARRMAASVRLIGRSDYGVGITGIAGPAGGSKRKPVGTVFIAISSKNKTICRKFSLKGGRTKIQKEAALGAIDLLKSFL